MADVTFIPRHIAEGSFPSSGSLLISICHPGDMADVDHWPNLFSLYFDDITFPSAGYTMFSVEMAKALLQRVDAHDGDVVVHCEAGMSRSAAIALWLMHNRHFCLWMHSEGIGTTKFYNRFVYEVLDVVDEKRRI